MENKIYTEENYNIIYNRKNKLVKQMLYLSLIYLVIIIILGLFLLKNHSTIFLVSTISLTVIYGIIIGLIYLVKYKRISSYDKLYNEIRRFKLDKQKVIITNFVDGYRTVNGLRFKEYKSKLFDDQRKERIILIDENNALDLKVDEVYTVTLSNTYLVNIEEVDILPLTIDDKLTKDRVIGSFNYSWYIYILVVGILSLGLTAVEHYATLPNDSETIRIWIDRPSEFTTSMVSGFHNKAKEMGFKDSLVYEYYYQTTSDYSVAFSTLGLYNTDIYILVHEEDNDYEDPLEVYGDRLFMDLSILGIEEGEFYTVNNQNIGIKKDDYYILVRKDNTKTNEQLKEMIEYLLEIK